MQQEVQKFSPIKQRILQYVDTLGISKREFYAKTGISRGTLESPTGITEETLTKFFATFKDVDPLWIISGEKNKRNEYVIKSNNEALVYDTDSIIRIPVFDASFAAGLSGCINGAQPNVEEYLAIPQTMLKRGAVYAGIRSKGQSMSPTIFDSDRLIVRMLDKSEWMDMRDEHVYAIIDNESRGFLKRVKNRFEQGFIVCMSDNLDKINYPNFTMRADEVVSIWHADLHVSALMPNINETYYNRLKRLEDKVDTIFGKLL
ncbi:S24 family peptidase [Paludibacter sp.]|uniref:S24 family peptidase n=1 Tax=Paludibacter sp. TaxID=1898105 RepID=UPI0013534E24|nr:S24 family peptidase [Paludibacter sp.]MTK53328.1 helix-turn-helix transcriptional regulator [Paludibacter sp.]